MSSSTYNVLAVDDNHLNCFLLKEAVKDSVVQLTVANSGQEALDKLKEHEYHLVLMDIHMPEMSGIEVTKKIRDPKSEVVNRNIPILAVTADLIPSTKEKALAAGMNGLIYKPFNVKEIMSDLLNVLTEKK